MMGDLGFGCDKTRREMGRRGRGATIAALQAAIADVRTSGLNIMMSMKEEGKPISFVEDCAVPLSTSRTTPRASPRCSRSTARAAPGTRTPRSAACMCARC